MSATTLSPHRIHRPSPPEPVRLRLDRPADVTAAAAQLAAGAVVAHGFGNISMITSRADAATVRRVNLLKGRPASQVASITTTRSRIPAVWDWDRLPVPLTRRRVQQVIDTFFGLGPFGFRGPAAAHVPAHLTSYEAGVRTAQVIAPGYTCPSNSLLRQACEAVGSDVLSVDAVADLGGSLTLLEHDDEEAARRRYLAFAPMSTTILGFHRIDATDGLRPCLTLERHGSLHAELIRDHLDALGFGLHLGPGARRRLPLRDYARPAER